MDQTELHNQIVKDIVASIVKPPIDSGGDMADALVILESVVLGVVILAYHLGFDPHDTVDNMAEQVKQRFAKTHVAQ